MSSDQQASAGIQFLVATVDSKFSREQAQLQSSNVVVVNQHSGLPIVSEDPAVQVINMPERGLSKSRNAALARATAEFVVICDDDVRYREDAAEIIAKAFAQHPDVDGLTFQIESLPGERPFKKYRRSGFTHNLLSLGRVSSIEIAIRRETFSQSGITFDEDFGLGSRYPTSEEFIFLTDAFKKGIKLAYVPIVICQHKYESTGKNVLNKTQLRAKGAVFRRVFGLPGFIPLLFFTLRKSVQFRSLPLVPLFEVSKGFWEYRQSRKPN